MVMIAKSKEQGAENSQEPRAGSRKSEVSLRSSRQERKRLLRFRGFVLSIGIALAVALPACKKTEPPVSDAEVRAVAEKTLPSAIEDPLWERIPLHPAKLLMQDVVEPRLVEASTSTVSVQAATDGQRIVFRLSWDDPTEDDTPGPGRFADAVAV